MKKIDMLIYPIIFFCLISVDNISLADEMMKEFPPQHEFIKKLNNTLTISGKEKIYKEIRDVCPFRNKNSQLEILGAEAISLNISASLPDKKREECEALLDGFNRSYMKTRDVREMAGDPSAVFPDEEKRDQVENQLKNAEMATTSFRTMLSAQCEFENSGGVNSAVQMSNHLTNMVETSSSILMFINPFAGIIGLAASATGRLLTTMGRWLMGKNENQLAEEAKNSNRFINDLCSFRELAQRYDEFYVDPFLENKKNQEVAQEKIEFAERKKARRRELSNLKKQDICIEEKKNEFKKLNDFSDEMTRIVNKVQGQGVSEQRQCLNLMNYYRDQISHKTEGEIKVSLHELAEKYGCPKPTMTPVEMYQTFCKNINDLDLMALEDIYEKCEQTEFQKKVENKFTNLSVIILRDKDTSYKKISPVSDAIQKLKEEEREDKLKHDEFLAIYDINDASPIVNASTNKAMTNLGRNLLGFRLDEFIDNALEASTDDLKEVKKILARQVIKKKDLDANDEGFFTKKKTPEEVELSQKKICDKSEKAKRRLVNVFHSNAGVRDLCIFMSGKGIPPLKNIGLNYDVYSADTDNQERSISNRCDKVMKKIDENFATIKDQMNLETSLGCL